MKEKLFTTIREIVYHPVYARIAYDITISIFSSIFSYIVFSANINLFFTLLFTVFFIGINFAQGVYKQLRMSSAQIKFATLSLSSLFAFFLCISLGGSWQPLLNTMAFVSLLSSLPRIFLNFSNTQTKSVFHQVITNDSPILVIGGGGYIGSVLVEEMLAKNMKVRVFDKFIYGKDIFNDLVGDRLELIEGDATDVYSLTLALRNVKAVVHLAGIVGDPASMVDDRLTRHMNIVSTRMIKESVKAFRIPKFIFASSCSVYGANDKIVDEKSALNPLSPYAKSKIDSEKEILQDTFDEFNPTILRFATVFGHSRKPRFDLVFNLFLAQAFNNGLITVMGESQWRPFIHVRDVAKAIIKVLEAPTSSVSRQVFNVGDDNMHATIGEIAEISKKSVKNRDVKVVMRDNKADLRNYRVSFKKFAEQFDYKAQINLEEGAREIIENLSNGVYKKPYTDVYYSAFETTKEIKKEFYSENYQKTHFSDLFVPEETK